jgi:hypothetical protein
MTKLLFLVVAVCFCFTVSAQIPNYVPQNGLVGWWPFNGNANDESGNGNHGTVNGATLTQDRFGNTNMAYSFDGVDDFNEIDVNSYLQNGLTISVWIVSNLPNAQFTHKGIVWTRLSGPQGNPPFQPNQTTGLMIYPDGLLCNASDGYSNGVSVQDSGNYYNDNSWYHLVFSYDVITGLTRITINGNETVSLNSISLANIDLAYNTIKIGKDEIVGYGNRHWYGKIDDIGIWNRALTACEIQDLYHAQLNSASMNISAGLDQSICAGDNVTLNGAGGSNYQWNNNVVDGQAFTPNQSANYVLNGTDSLGCQGTDTVEVTVLENATSTLTQTALDSYTLNGQTYTQSGTYTQTVPAANGCDSTITLNLTLNFTGIDELGTGAKKLVKITDLNGKVIPRRKNTLMLFIYEDGTVERVVEMEE